MTNRLEAYFYTRTWESEHEKVPGGWEVRCDGMPRLTGCGETIVVTRQYRRYGTKKSGWLVIPALDDDGVTPDLDFPMFFCPDCAKVVIAQKKAADA